MQIRHELGAGAVRLDQLVGHVIGVAGRETNSLKSLKVVKRPDQPGKRPIPVGASSVICIHILAEKRDFAYAAFDKVPRFLDDPFWRATDLRAAGVRDHAKSAKLVASLLHRQECSRSSFCLWAVAEVLKLVLGREIGV